VKAVTLLYHDVVENAEFSSSGFKGGDADFYKLTDEEFSTHIKAISAEGFKAKNLSKLIDGNLTGTTQFLTFDDGGRSFLKPIADILEKNQQIGLFFISTDFIGTPGFLTEEEIKALHARGHVIGSHSCSHPKKISDCTREELLHEWAESKRILSEIIGEEVLSGSIPGGFLSEAVVKAAVDSGYKVLFTSEPLKRITKYEGCYLVGRYSLTQGMGYKSAISLSKLHLSHKQLKQFVLWNVKKFLKRYFGGIYRQIRLKLLS